MEHSAGTQDLLDRIALGEDSFLELKELTIKGAEVLAPAPESLAEELAAMANAHGGVCLLGVRDAPREIVGIDLECLDDAETWVRNICADLIVPPLAPSIARVALPGPDGTRRAILKVDVPRSLFVHESPGGYFHRVGSSKRKMPPDYLARLFQQRSQARIIRFDEQPVPGSSLSELSQHLYDRFRTDLSADEPRDIFLDKLAMARTDEGGVLRPTVAGVLMASPDPRRYLPNAFIQAVAYAGTEISPAGDAFAYQIDAADITGPLDQQVFDALRFVARNMRTAAYKDIGRRDLPQYDLSAVFEALVNAVAHRDYSMYGSKTRLRLFSDRLELYSPGALANTMTVGSIAYRQAARNEALASLLAKCAISIEIGGFVTTRKTVMDRRGEGVGVVFRNSERLSGVRPRYEMFDESELVLTIWAAQPRLAGEG